MNLPFPYWLKISMLIVSTNQSSTDVLKDNDERQRGKNVKISYSFAKYNCYYFNFKKGTLWSEGYVTELLHKEENSFYKK